MVYNMYCNILKVDCTWSSWQDSSLCSTSCGAGVRISTRLVEKQAKHGGKRCVGPSEIHHVCNEKPCAGTQSFYMILEVKYS